MTLAALAVDASRSARADDSRLWDPSRQLPSRNRADLENHLSAAGQQVGSPIFVLVVDRLHHETAAGVATRTFASRRLGGGDGDNPVLLVVAVHDRAAAIETGKGNAAIVPEVDARQITETLAHLSEGTLDQDLTRAIDAIVASAEATIARRRPTPESEDEPSTTADGGDTADGATMAGAAGEPEAAETKGAPDAGPAGPSATETKPRGRSRIPFAAAIGVLLLLALALRRRRALTGSREDPPRRDPPRRKPPSA